MQITVGKILASKDALRRLAEQQFNVRLAYKVLRLCQQVEKEYVIADQQRTLLIKKHGEEVDGGYAVSAEKMDAYQVELKELIDTEINVEIDVLNLSEFSSDFKITPNDIYTLSDFIDNDA